MNLHYFIRHSTLLCIKMGRMDKLFFFVVSVSPLNDFFYLVNASIKFGPQMRQSHSCNMNFGNNMPFQFRKGCFTNFTITSLGLLGAFIMNFFFFLGLVGFMLMLLWLLLLRGVNMPTRTAFIVSIGEVLETGPPRSGNRSAATAASTGVANKNNNSTNLNSGQSGLDESDDSSTHSRQGYFAKYEWFFF